MGAVLRYSRAAKMAPPDLLGKREIVDAFRPAGDEEGR
jgi:hypothetical protein